MYILALNDIQNNRSHILNVKNWIEWINIHHLLLCAVITQKTVLYNASVGQLQLIYIINATRAH